MSSRFKPFDLGAAEATPGNAGFKVKVMPSDSATTAFKPLSGMLGKSGARSGDDAVESEERSTVKKSDVALERDEQDRIKRIVVSCACGRKHELDCEY